MPIGLPGLRGIGAREIDKMADIVTRDIGMITDKAIRKPHGTSHDSIL
jgi:hypothetical protein